jgi:uncharacterized protein
MKIISSLFLTLITITGFAQKKDNRITIGTVDTVYSKILTEKRIIYIHVPDGDKN